MNNPFYVEPMGGYGPSIVQGLSGLGSVIAARQEEKRKKAEEQALIQEAQSVFESNDPTKIAQFYIKAPEFAKRVQGAVTYKNDATEKNMMQSMQRILSGENPEQVIVERAQMVQEQGGDPIDTLQELDVYRQDPEGYQKQVERAYARMDPQGFIEFRKATTDQTSRSTPYQQGTGPLSGYVFDPATGEYKPAFPEGEMPKRDDRTTTQKDFEYIQDLRDRGMDNEADALEVKLKIRQPGSPEVAAAEATFNKENVLSTFDRSLDAINSILEDPAIESNVFWRAATRNLPASEARAFEGKIRVLQSQAFLNEIEKMKGFGALSEAEGRKVSDAVANLDTLQDNGALKAQIKIAQDIFTAGRERAERKLNVIESEAKKKIKSGNAQAPATNGDFSGSDIEAAAKQLGISPEQFRKEMGL